MADLTLTTDDEQQTIVTGFGRCGLVGRANPGHAMGRTGGRAPAGKAADILAHLALEHAAQKESQPSAQSTAPGLASTEILLVLRDTANDPQARPDLQRCT